MGFAGYVAICMQLYCRGKLSLFYTTCFGLYGHLQACGMLLLADGNIQKCNHVQDTEKTSEADSFMNMRVITSYTLEDGHIGRNM
jgi:hypothetical protein